MPYEPRTIALLCELLHPPLPPDPRPVQQIHNDMFQSNSPSYSSFAVTPLGPVLTNPGTGPGKISQVLFLQDQIQFREEQTGLPYEHFAGRVESIADRFAQARNVENFAGQRITVRALISPHHHRDARTFLDQALFSHNSNGQADSTDNSNRVQQAFGQPASLYGLRLAFDGTEEGQSSIGLRIESYAADTRSLFVELQAAYGPAQPHQSSDILSERIHSLYDFLENRTLPFIQNYDQAQQA